MKFLDLNEKVCEFPAFFGEDFCIFFFFWIFFEEFWNVKFEHSGTRSAGSDDIVDVIEEFDGVFCDGDCGVPVPGVIGDLSATSLVLHDGHASS